ncbi:hypothetical protein O181_020849 [Austropuccinia psidii MF-1]|uniref:Chromo domain-containing protein n=1 Tax=Austropuccinia psidii MF-1 TaxID=1389203 RepID=A0A9Q3GW36_9BASI|nr:hypothetical protein [Austropuccinia psidii MF-1]
MPSQSLIQSRDEVFKEIKDVSLSSLDLIPRGIHLPPLSFHASLQEQWDEQEEPEEIETVLKVVPPSDHQQSDVFYKVKEEKLPPHHSREHHIKQEGLLPPEALSQFQILKEDFTTSPILSDFNPSLPTILEIDASDYALGAVLSQELLGIVWSLKHWRAFLLSPSNSFEVFTDHSSLQYFMSSKVLTCCRLATLPDVFSHQYKVYPERGVDFISNNPQSFHKVIKKDGIKELIFFLTKAEIFSALVDQIKNKVWKEKYYKEIIKKLERDSPSGKLSTKIQSVQKVLKEYLQSEISQFEKYADRKRTISPDFQSGDRVWLASKNIKTTRLIKKPSERLLGPFEVLKKIGIHAYHLKFPLKWKSVHSVFHVSLLKTVKRSSIPNQSQLPPLPVLVEEQEEWEVSQVLDSKIKRGKLCYLVDGKGFSEYLERSAWKPASKLIKDFHSLYPDKPGPNT